MRIIVCLDDKNGMLFNNRRQSRDRVLINDMCCLVGDKQLLINSFSKKLFTEVNFPVTVQESFLETAGEDDYCFVENCYIKSYVRKISVIVVYRWNRRYPADFTFDINLMEEGFKLKEVYEFRGYSHSKITREIYVR